MLPWLYLFPVAAAFWLAAIFLGSADTHASHLGHLTVAQYSLATLLMLGVWKLGPQSQNLWDYRWIILIAIVARLLLVFVDPYTSNDVDRYLFDGYIAVSGLDPYSISHDAAQLSAGVSEWQPPAEHLKYSTIYPPLAISLYAIAASFGADAASVVWNLMVLCASLATLWVSIVVLNHTNKLHHTALVALSPILVFESGIGLHIDSFAALFVVAMLYFWMRARYFLVGVFIGLGTLVKFLPLVLAGATWLCLRTWKDRLLLPLGLLVCLALGYGSALVAGWVPVGSLGVFFEKFRFGSPIFNLIETTVPAHIMFPAVLALLIVGYFCIALYVIRASRRAPHVDQLIVALQVSLSLPLVFGPVVYPWYLMVLVPLVALRPNLLAITWLALLPLTYEVLGQWICCNQWQPAQWPLVTLICGIILALLVTIYRRMRAAPESC